VYRDIYPIRPFIVPVLSSSLSCAPKREGREKREKKTIMGPSKILVVVPLSPNSNGSGKGEGVKQRSGTERRRRRKRKRERKESPRDAYRRCAPPLPRARSRREERGDHSHLRRPLSTRSPNPNDESAFEGRGGGRGEKRKNAMRNTGALQWVYHCLLATCLSERVLKAARGKKKGGGRGKGKEEGGRWRVSHSRSNIDWSPATSSRVDSTAIG